MSHPSLAKEMECVIRLDIVHVPKDTLAILATTVTLITLDPLVQPVRLYFVELRDKRKYIVLKNYCTDCSREETCNGKGTCSSAGDCECDRGWNGESCDTCASNYFDSACSTCMSLLSLFIL